MAVIRYKGILITVLTLLGSSVLLTLLWKWQLSRLQFQSMPRSNQYQLQKQQHNQYTSALGQGLGTMDDEDSDEDDDDDDAGMLLDRSALQEEDEEVMVQEQEVMTQEGTQNHAGNESTRTTGSRHWNVPHGRGGSDNGGSGAADIRTASRAGGSSG